MGPEKVPRMGDFCVPGLPSTQVSLGCMALKTLVCIFWVFGNFSFAFGSAVSQPGQTSSDNLSMARFFYRRSRSRVFMSLSLFHSNPKSLHFTLRSIAQRTSTCALRADSALTRRSSRGVHARHQSRPHTTWLSVPGRCVRPACVRAASTMVQE
jgi:hypothetical protein